MNKHLLIPLMLLALVAGACAKKNTSTTGQDTQEYLELWIEKYYPDIVPNEDGLYILEETVGTGAERNANLPYVYVTSTIRGLNGVISNTTSEDLAKQLGTYSKGDYYGPRFQMVGEGSSYAGVDALLKGMKVGGTRKAVVPAWMLTTSRYNTQQEYLDKCSVTASLIYEIGLYGQTENPEADGIKAVKDYVQMAYGSQQKSTTYKADQEDDGSFYFVSDSTFFKDVTKIAAGETVKMNYIGMRLDGTIFDTNVEKVAKDAGIYNREREYTPLSVTYASSYSSISVGGSSSYIDGFKAGLYLMHWKGQEATVIFSSKHGYSSSGSGTSIPPYEPLIFELVYLAD